MRGLINYPPPSPPSPPSPPLSQWHEADGFVKSVNTVLLAQSETERVRDAMSRVTSYTAVDVPHEYREVRYEKYVYYYEKESVLIN